MSHKSCVSPETLAAFVAGRLSAEQDREVVSHLEACRECELRAEEIERSSDGLVESLRSAARSDQQGVGGSGARTSMPADLSRSDAGAPDRTATDATDPLTGHAPANASSIPLQLEGYRIVREIGRGGMGVVYEAYQHRLKRLVAIKMILTGSLAGAEERFRFLMEGELLARLNHPNFVQVYEVGTIEATPGTVQPYLVMEYVQGGSLRRRMQNGPMPIDEAVRTALVLARAMAAAHAQGIIHRDLKPANVLVAESGALKITDFGLAKEVQASASLTPTGLMVGTPLYMAPEQATGRGNMIGPLVDVYALGAIFYEMLAGTPPFPGDTPMEVLLGVLEKAPSSPRHLRADVPRDLETICLKCLEKEPRRRYASASELAADLENWLEHRPIRARATGKAEHAWKWMRRHPLSASLLVILMVSLLAGSTVSTYFGISANLRAQEKEQALLQEAEARRAAQRRAAELQLVAGQRFARDGDVDRGLFTLVRGWQQTPAEDTDLQQVFQRNVEAWAGYLPRLRWYVDTPGLTNAVVTRDAVVFCTQDKVMARDIATGLPTGPAREVPGQEIMALSPDGRRVCARIMEEGDLKLRVFDWSTGGQVGKDLADARGAELRQKTPSAYYRASFVADTDLLLREFISLTHEERQLWDVATGKPIAPPLVGSWSAVRVLAGKSGEPYWLLISGKEGAEIRRVRAGDTPGDTTALPADVAPPLDLYPNRQIFQTLLGGDMKWWELGARTPTHATWQLSSTGSFHQISTDGRHLLGLLGLQRISWHDLANRRLCLPTAGVEPGAFGQIHCVQGRGCLYARTAKFLKLIDFPRLLPARADHGRLEEALGLRALTPPLAFGGAAFDHECRTAILHGVAGVHRKSYACLTSVSDNRPLGLPMTDCDTRAVLSPSGRLVALATWDDTRDKHPPLVVRVYDAKTGEPRSRTWEIEFYMHALAFSPDEKFLAVGHVKGAYVCDLIGQGEAVKLFQPGPVSRLLFSPDGRRLALVGRSGWGNKAGVRVWDTATAKPVGAFVATRNAPLIYAEPEDAFRIIDLDNGRMQRWTFSAAAPVADLGTLADWPSVARGTDEGWALRADKRWLALGSRHGAIWQWDLHTGQKLGPLAEFHQPVRSLAYAPDGSWLAAGGDDGEVALIDPLSAKQAGPLLSQGMPLCGMAFTPDGTQLITALRNGRCVRWRMGDRQALRASDWALWLEAATGMRLEGDMLMPLSVAEHQERLEAARSLAVPVGFSSGLEPDWCAEQALQAEQAGQLHAALWHLDRWIELAPLDWLPHARRARINALQGLAKDAEADMKRAAALCRDNGLENWRRHQSVRAGIVGKSLPIIESRAP